MSSHMDTKHKIQSISRRKTFEDLIESATLSDEEKEILRDIYVHQHALAFIGDKLGYSEEGMKKKHSKILRKLARLI